MGRPVRVLPEQTQADLRRLAGTEPPELLGYFLGALNDAGWGYQPAATALGLSRQQVHSRALHGHQMDGQIPEVPPLPERPQKPPRPVLSRAEARQLRTLQDKAVQLRGHHSANHPYRLASERLSKLINDQLERGIGYKDIGDVIGVKPMTVRARLKRHGYRVTNPALRPYRKPERREAS